jgi:hypothetical protein
VDLDNAARQWQTHGYVILPGFIPPAELRPALAELPGMYPTAEGFHDGTDVRRDRQLEMFVYLVDVPEELGPPSMLSRARTTGLPAKPNWYPRGDGADADGGWAATAGSPGLYDAEVRAAGPAGTVVAWAPGTFHRGTALTLPRGARYTIHLGYRPASAEWGQRMPWVNRSHDVEWYEFVHRATLRQLALFGLPPPGHPYWTEATVAGTAQRYPGLDMTAWRQALHGQA